MKYKILGVMFLAGSLFCGKPQKPAIDPLSYASLQSNLRYILDTAGDHKGSVDKSEEDFFRSKWKQGSNFYLVTEQGEGDARPLDYYSKKMYLSIEELKEDNKNKVGKCVILEFNDRCELMDNWYCTGSLVKDEWTPPPYFSDATNFDQKMRDRNRYILDHIIGVDGSKGAREDNFDGRRSKSQKKATLTNK